MIKRAHELEAGDVLMPGRELVTAVKRAGDNIMIFVERGKTKSRRTAWCVDLNHKFSLERWVNENQAKIRS